MPEVLKNCYFMAFSLFFLRYSTYFRHILLHRCRSTRVHHDKMRKYEISIEVSPKKTSCDSSIVVACKIVNRRAAVFYLYRENIIHLSETHSSSNYFLYQYSTLYFGVPRQS